MRERESLEEMANKGEVLRWSSESEGDELPKEKKDLVHQY